MKKNVAGIVFVILVVAGVSYSQVPNGGQCAMSPECANGMVLLYKDDGTGGGVYPINAMETEAYKHIRLPKGTEDEASSIQWKLPRGVTVVFYEHSGKDFGKKQREFALYGQGCIKNLDWKDLNDKVSSYIVIRS